MVTPLVAVSDNPCRVCCWLFSSACALLCFLVSFCRHLCCPCLLRARAFPCPGAFPCLCLGILSRRVRQSCPSLLPASGRPPGVGYLPCLLHSGSCATSLFACCLLLVSATRLLTTWRAPATCLRAIRSCVFLVQFRLRSLAVPHRGAPFMLACAGCSGCVFIALQHPQPCLGVSFSAACLLPAYFPCPGARIHHPLVNCCPPLSSAAR